MSDPEDKTVVLASPEWYELACRILAEVARECGEDGFRLSVCEVFIDAPKEFADEDGTVSWCFYIDGKDVRCEKGNSKDVDLYMQAPHSRSGPSLPLGSGSASGPATPTPYATTAAGRCAPVGVCSIRGSWDPADARRIYTPDFSRRAGEEPDSARGP